MKLPDHKRPIAFDAEYFLSTKIDNVLAVMRGNNKATLHSLRIRSAYETNKIISVITK